MTQPVPALPPPESEEQGAHELDRLRETTDRDVAAGSRRVAGLSSEEEEDRKRRHRDVRREAWAKVETWAIKSVGIIGILLAACFAILIVCIVARWLGIVFKNPAKLDDLVKGSFWTILVALATAGGNALLRRDD